jgi:SAM-dependent methyltransferase
LPLANDLRLPGQPEAQEERFPLTLTSCPSCGLVQLGENIDPEQLYRHYVYSSSNSPAFVRHAKELSNRIIDERRLGPQSRVIEIASNDGYLLQFYRRAGASVLGIEPAANIAELAQARGIETIADFFSAALAQALADRGLAADVVHAHNVLAHVPDLRGFVRGIGAILKQTGVAILEFPYLCDLIANLEFDTIYHEHLCYFSLTPLVNLFEVHGLVLRRVERIRMHGGSLRMAAHCDSLW